MKKSRAPRPPFGLVLSSTRLALDAQQVIALRLAKLALGGPAAKREATKMIAEKVKAFSDSQRVVLSAATRGQGDRAAERVIGLYQRRVSANKRRLGKRA